MGSMKKSAVVLLLLSFFLFSGNVVEGQGRTCETPSGYFRGPCFFNGDCIKACKDEQGVKFLSGAACKSFRCMCRKPC
ncbi:hypothetical protein QJS04_geneDACA018893 [Acorus gramineus]|uniref:Knottins-like domain-containing protein n=1 Tax=Acorus gramineus TaxID=55184 RepID=A0AAV8ZXF7_ACOGR|nr:hypothetical protein QJS04_geneDACA018893 [Acorus gramineus]